MGYRGKLREQDEARQLRAEGRTLSEIAAKVGVSKSSVSLWVRDVEFTPSPRRYGARRRPSRLHEQKLREIAELDAEGERRLGCLNEQAFLAAGAALYAGEGTKRDHAVVFANTDPSMIAFFCRWLRSFFDVDESRLRARVYLHQGLDLDAAEQSWSEVTGIPRHQFRAPYRVPADPSIRLTKHAHGCCYVCYSSKRLHRTIMGLIRALLSTADIPG